MKVISFFVFLIVNKTGSDNTFTGPINYNLDNSVENIEKEELSNLCLDDLNESDEKNAYFNFIKKLFKSDAILMNKIIDFESDNSIEFDKNEIYQLIINGIYRIPKSDNMLKSLCSYFIYRGLYHEFLEIYYFKISEILKNFNFENSNIENVESKFIIGTYMEMKNKMKIILNDVFESNKAEKDSNLYDQVMNLIFFENSFESFIECCNENFIFRITDHEKIVLEIFSPTINDQEKSLFTFNYGNSYAMSFIENCSKVVFNFSTEYNKYLDDLKKLISKANIFIIDISYSIKKEFFANEKISMQFFNSIADFLAKFEDRKKFQFQFFDQNFTLNNKFSEIDMKFDYEIIIARTIRSNIRNKYPEFLFSDNKSNNNVKISNIMIHNGRMDLYSDNETRKSLETQNKKVCHPLNCILEIYNCMNLRLTKNDVKFTDKKRIDNDFLSKLSNEHIYPINDIGIGSNYDIELEYDTQLYFDQGNEIKEVNIELYGNFSNLNVYTVMSVNIFIHNSFKHIIIFGSKNIMKIENIFFYKDYFSKEFVINNVLLLCGYLNLNLSNSFILANRINSIFEGRLAYFKSKNNILTIKNVICYIKFLPININNLLFENCEFSSLHHIQRTYFIFFSQIDTLKLSDNIFLSESIIIGRIRTLILTHNRFEKKIFIPRIKQIRFLIFENCYGQIQIINFILSNNFYVNDSSSLCSVSMNKNSLSIANYQINGTIPLKHPIVNLNCFKCIFQEDLKIELSFNTKCIDISWSDGSLEIYSQNELLNFGKIQFRGSGFLFLMVDDYHVQNIGLKNLCFSTNPSNIVEKNLSKVNIIQNVSYYDSNNRNIYLKNIL